MIEDSLGDRMKRYEHAYRHTLPQRLPVILRVDGRAFHTYTRGCEKPFDAPLIEAMNAVALALCEEIGGAQLAYAQSDEVSILIHGYKRHASMPWFAGEIQKMVSVGASVASATMTTKLGARLGPATFDARVFVVPEHDVCNYFVWRQKDWMRNSVQMLARSQFSQHECQEKHIPDLCDMLRKVGYPWENLSSALRLGRVFARQTETVTGMHPHSAHVRASSTITRSVWRLADPTPIFTDDRAVVESLLAVEDEDSARVSA